MTAGCFVRFAKAIQWRVNRLERFLGRVGFQYPVFGFQFSVFSVSDAMTPTEQMQEIDAQVSHVWMVRAFLKHSDEAAEDDELAEVHRELYDYMLALGGPLKEGDAEEYLRLAQKKLAKLKRANELFQQIQPEVSQHTNFFMAAASLRQAVAEIERLLALAGS
jgi:cob(I)alamin adenosyltransferase